MDTRHKILFVDDEPDVLELYSELLAKLPSQPEVRTAPSGARALTMLEDETFRLLICDLRMPKVDGLQVLSFVRRKHPHLRTVAFTSVEDEQFRSRAYGLGVDYFWHKPGNEQETKMFLDCMESLLTQEDETGFRGVQSKSLIDILQLECMSKASAVLRITNGPMIGKIWIQDGEVIDAETAELRSEPAIQKILSWPGGGFETLPADPSRPRTITKPYSALLLESAQAVDETQAPRQEEPVVGASLPLAFLSEVKGLEFALAIENPDGRQIARGLENPDAVSNWARATIAEFQALGEQLNAGHLVAIEGTGVDRQVTLVEQGNTEFCLGWSNTLDIEEVREQTRKVLSLWAC